MSQAVPFAQAALIVLAGRLAELVTARGAFRALLSMSSDGGYSIAMASLGNHTRFISPRAGGVQCNAGILCGSKAVAEASTIGDKRTSEMISI
jgi:hypothetical protein